MLNKKRYVIIIIQWLAYTNHWTVDLRRHCVMKMEIGMNFGTAVVLLILVLIVGRLVYGLIRDKRNGVSSCGGDCASCGGICHTPKAQK